MSIAVMDLRYYPTVYFYRFIFRPLEVLEDLLALELGKAFNLQYEVNIFFARLCPHRGWSPDHRVG